MLNLSELYSAIIKSMSGRFAVFAIQLFTMAVYARMFSPKEFGILASIQVFVVFFQVISDVGIGPAIINERDFNKEKRNGIYSFTLIFGIFLAIIFYLFSFYLNELYEEYRYQDIAILVCVSIFFNSLNIMSNTALVKDAKFMQIAISDLMGELVALIIVWSLHHNGFGVLALASRSAVQSVVKLLLNRHFSKYTIIGKAKLGKEITYIKSIIGFSSYQFGFNFINYFSRNLDNILIGRYFGMAQLGIYDKAYQLMRYPLVLTTFAMNPAIQPVLTKIRDDTEQVVKEHNKLAVRLLAITIPISVFLFLNAKLIVLFMLGEQWLSIVKVVEIFCFMIPIQSVLSTSGSFYQVMNKPKLLFVTGFTSALINIMAISIGIYIGDILSIASCLVLSFSINFFIVYHVLFKYCFRLKVYSFYKSIFKVFIKLVIPTFCYIYIVLNWISMDGLNVFFQLIFNSLILVLMYLACFVNMRKSY